MLIKQNTINSIEYGIWKIEETTESLFKLLDNKNEADNNYLSAIKTEERLREKLAVRVLLKKMIGNDISIEYTETGKPLLPNKDVNISISHTRGYAAVAISSKDRFGIDIEKQSDKVLKIRSKFVSEKDSISESNPLQHLLLYWSAKESMYKAINIKGIDFKNNLRISNFEPQTAGIFEGYTDMMNKKHKFNIHYLTTNEYVLTIACSQ